MVSKVEVCQMSPWRRHLRTPVGTPGFLLQPSHVSRMPPQGVVKWCQLLRGPHTIGAPLLPECLLVQERRPWSLNLLNLPLKAVDDGQSGKLKQGSLPSTVPVVVSIHPFYTCGICLDIDSSLLSEFTSQSLGCAPGAK